ncbi:hypothetical protein JCM6882_008237 [Rhodosporidiobolus microsporus]
MAPPKLSECVVCGTASSQKCGGCQKETYCSAACVKLHWILHKGICGQPTDTFYMPPLSKDEQIMLHSTRNAPGRNGGWAPDNVSLVAKLKQMNLWDRGFDDLLTTLTLPKDVCPVSEPQRSYLICYTRNHLAAHHRLEDDSVTTSQPGSFSFTPAPEGSFAFRTTAA